MQVKATRKAKQKAKNKIELAGLGHKKNIATPTPSRKLGHTLYPLKKFARAVYAHRKSMEDTRMNQKIKGMKVKKMPVARPDGTVVIRQTRHIQLADGRMYAKSEAIAILKA